MPQVSTLALDDSQTTAHNFVPVGQDANGVWWFEDASSGTAAVGFNRLSISLVRPGNPAPGASSENRNYRLKLALHTPKLEVVGNSSTGITPAPRVSYIPRATCEFILPDRSTQIERNDLRVMFANLLSNPSVTAAVDSLQGLY